MQKNITAIALGLGFIVFVGLGGTVVNRLAGTSAENSAALFSSRKTLLPDSAISAPPAVSALWFAKTVWGDATITARNTPRTSSVNSSLPQNRRRGFRTH